MMATQQMSAAPIQTSSTILPSDALVFLGATGDLACKKIFSALRTMVNHGISEVVEESPKI